MKDFESLYGEYFPKVYNYIYYRLLDRDRADDLASEVFMRAFEKLHTYDEGKAKLSTWVFSIARNALIDELRRKKDAVSLDEDDRPDVPSDFDVQLEYIKSEERRALYALLARINARDRDIIAMKYFAGMTNRGIAAELGMNESTVSSVLFNTIGKLREGMKGFRVI
ncbi:MAG: sigma-70 family RNA polymerase sigma factor [Oscillospiraceae bacterium]|nr:sigma-70 family RNA polymerase sigma factor [Oscillospiraceae bacterium]